MAYKMYIDRSRPIGRLHWNDTFDQRCGPKPGAADLGRWLGPLSSKQEAETLAESEGLTIQLCRFCLVSDYRKSKGGWSLDT